MPYRPTPRTEARKLRSREAILSAALEQVAEGGYRSASIHAIAARAGVATGTVYRYFPSKSELFAEVFERASRRELAVLEAIAGERSRPATERIAACIEVFARRALAGPRLAYAQIAEPVDHRVDSERLALRRGYRNLFAALVQEGIDLGELAEQDTDVVAAGLIGAIGEALAGPLAPGSGSAPRRQEALIAGIVSFCMSAIERRGGNGDNLAPAHALQHA
jgi:AcrR family transcriptional regulator